MFLCDLWSKHNISLLKIAFFKEIDPIILNRRENATHRRGDHIALRFTTLTKSFKSLYYIGTHLQELGLRSCPTGHGRVSRHTQPQSE